MKLEELNNLYGEYFYLEDKNLIPIIASAICSAELICPPVWMCLVGPSSGGKSEALMAFSQVKGVCPISDLTTNTLLSGMKGAQETSLLLKLGRNFTLIFKDFTTVLSKSEETQQAIMAQLREVYDGRMDKKTGNGQSIEWKGKATCLFASTEAIYSMTDKFNDLGARTLNYVLLEQDRIKTTKVALQNTNRLEAARKAIQEEFKNFIAEKLKDMPRELPSLPEEDIDEIIKIANFSCISRSVVKRDYKGAKSLALSAEMPMRMSKQMMAIMQTWTYLKGKPLTEPEKYAVYKLGFDSISKQRRLALEALVAYERVTIGGLGDLIRYPQERTKEWIEDLQMFGVVERIRLGQKQYWKIRDEYKEFLAKHLRINSIGGALEAEDETLQVGQGNYKEVEISYEERERRELEKKDWANPNVKGSDLFGS